MPVIVEILGNPSSKIFQKVFAYFEYVDETFSPYKAKSEVTRINDKRLKPKKASDDMKLILNLAGDTKEVTQGFFDIYQNKFMDPSGIVKGWAIQKASEIISDAGFTDFYVSAGGDIQTRGLNKNRQKWQVAIRNPFNLTQNVKVLRLSGEGVATSGTYERGHHIYNPKEELNDDIVSLTVVAKNVYEADRFATAAFAMGKDGINFIEKQKGLEGYMIDKNSMATMTRGFEKYANSK